MLWACVPIPFSLSVASPYILYLGGAGSVSRVGVQLGYLNYFARFAKNSYEKAYLFCFFCSVFDESVALLFGTTLVSRGWISALHILMVSAVNC